MQFKILSRGLVVVAGCVAFAGLTNDVMAQQSSMFGSSGGTGGGLGGAANTGSTMQSSMFPSSNFPAGGSSLQTAGLGSQNAFGQQGGGGANGQQQGLLGNSATSLIGIGQAGQSGQLVNGQNGQMTNRQGSQNRNNANRRTGQNRNQMNQAGGAAGTQQKSSVRPQLLVAFDHPQSSPDETQLAITTRFGKLANNEQFQGIQVETDGDAVILRGAVDSPRTSRLAAILAKMEPGVKNVRNELTVAEVPAPAP